MNFHGPSVSLHEDYYTLKNANKHLRPLIVICLFISKANGGSLIRKVHICCKCDGFHAVHFCQWLLGCQRGCMQTGKVYGTRTKSHESWFFQDQCLVKPKSISKVGYFWSEWNIHWKIWVIHKVLAVTFDLEEQLECSMKCFSLVMQELEHWPRVGDIQLSTFHFVKWN